jgi:hypothetical protein
VWLLIFSFNKYLLSTDNIHMSSFSTMDTSLTFSESFIFFFSLFMFSLLFQFISMSSLPLYNQNDSLSPLLTYMLSNPIENCPSLSDLVFYFLYQLIFFDLTFKWLNFSRFDLSLLFPLHFSFLFALIHTYLSPAQNSSLSTNPTIKLGCHKKNLKL